MTGLLRRLRNARFRRTRCERFLSFKQRRCNEANQYHPTQQSPHENDWFPGNENPHGRTSGDEERPTITSIIRRKKIPFSSLSSFFLVLPASAGVRERMFQISRQIHVFCRAVNGYVQTGFAAKGIYSSRETYMNLSSRVTGMPDLAHRCATATG